MAISRQQLHQQIAKALGRSRIVALLGPRPCGKTTLAREFLPSGKLDYFDLEDPVSLSRLSEPMTALAGLEGLVVIDEIQRAPGLFHACPLSKRIVRNLSMYSALQYEEHIALRQEI